MRSFADNSARVLIVKAEGSKACLGLQLPRIDVIPEKKAHTTPTGRLSSKVWPKLELNEAYAQLLAAHLLATGRELFAIAPSIQTLRVLGFLDGSAVAEGILFDVHCAREEGDWDSDDWGLRCWKTRNGV